MKHYIFITLAIFTLNISYGNAQLKEKTITTEFHSVFEIPDSLLTAEQNSLKRKLVDVLINNLDYKDDKFVFQMTKEEFLKKGFAPEYYDIIINDTKTSNKTIKSDDTIDWGKLLKNKIQKFKNKDIEQKEIAP